jgi:protein-S-isoprenylcysteine O-methyltransferase Ste14
VKARDAAAGSAACFALAPGVVAGVMPLALTGWRAGPAPAAPTERLVVGGLYRYVRNPMSSP